MEKKISFIYKICSRCTPYMTTNPVEAEAASKNGCRVTCVGKVYSHSDNYYQHGKGKDDGGIF